jgi:nucleoredoxin
VSYVLFNLNTLKLHSNSHSRCGPCRKFTPELVQFYEKMKSRRGKANSFEIIWVSRCRDVKSYEQYFTHMKWPALPPDQAMGQRGQMLFEKYKVKGIPSLVLLDDVGNVITLDARNKIPQDKAGIGFPWRNPLSTLYLTFVPKSLRYIIKAQMIEIQKRLNLKLKSLLPARKTT